MRLNKIIFNLYTYIIIYEKYINCINSFINNDIDSWSFKSNPDYCEVLEHVSENLGREYLLEIKNRFDVFFNTHKNYLIELCHTNDLYGKTVKHEFDNFTICSPTNLRYILHSLLILKYMEECDLNNVNVIEIGGGYGGLCFFVCKLSKLFNININTYTIFDLHAALILQKKYIEIFNIGVNVNYCDINNIENNEKLNVNSFLISNYAFSEISSELQDKYKIQVLNPYCSYGFLAWNCIELYNFIDNKNIMSEKEFPMTGNDKNNYVRFRPVDKL